VEEFVLLEDEITTIENYLALQKFRFPDKFDYTIEVDESIDVASYSLPPMLAQPFIENAIEHGMKHKNGKGHISVRFEKQNTGMNMIIEDNGIGREKAGDICRRVNKGHKSMATTITCERIKLLNKKCKNKIAMEIIDLKDETTEAKGTRVVFEVAV
jgi:sensor histidine kinase YesM